MTHPIIYKTIPTQYAFLIKEDTYGGYFVKVQPTNVLKEQFFETREEAEAFINQERVL